MKKYILIALCTIHTINSMEQAVITREPREWDAQSYDKGNQLQTNLFLHLLETNNIKIEDRTILSVGCGTGKIENILAEKATHIDASDASKNMIEQAQKNFGHVKNLTFKHCFAEDIISDKLYNLALASCCIHWFEDKKQAFQRINDCLELHGELFGTVQTIENPSPTNLVVALEMWPTFQNAVKSATNTELPDLDSKNMQTLAGCSYLHHQEFNTILEETGFEIIRSEEAYFNNTTTKEELKQLQWPIISSRPFIKPLPLDVVETLFEDFISRYINKLQKIDDNKFLDKHFTTVIHARKINK
jgi:ubiquinone/menaquinone biosynthesis C-methylase UbiE